MARKQIKKGRAKARVKKTHLQPEVVGLLLISLGLIALISLMSFTHHEPDKNWLGAVGYTVALSYHAILGLGGFFAAIAKVNYGWRLLCQKPLSSPRWHLTYTILLTLSFCALATLVADEMPSWLSGIQSHLYSESLLLDGPYPYLHMRLHAGGIPMYFLYKDATLFNLRALLSPSGVGIVFSILFFASSTYLLRRSISRAFHAFIASRKERKKQVQRAVKTTDPTIRALLFKRLKQWLATSEKTEPRESLPTYQGKPRVISPTFPKMETEPERPDLPIAKKRREKTSAEPSPSERRAQALKQQKVYNGDFAEYLMPKIDFLKAPKAISQGALKNDLIRLGHILEETLSSFGIDGKVGNIHCGPRIASFEVHPPVGVKVQKIKALENDIALNMQAKSTRIIAPIPGKAAVGIEIPNPKPHEVSFRELLELYQASDKKHEIPVLLGKSTHGELITADLARMPHCLIAGATGSGKSVCINTIILSILMTARPDEIKLLMVDPKKVELTGYSNLPHMIAPVITEPHGALSAVQWLVREMQTRYEILKKLRLRNILSFNSRTPDKEKEEALDIAIPDKMPYIVAIIDELADLMMAAGADIETPIARIAQMARAVGIHMILATQRPSREVITGLIKANFPTRISFKVASKINSSIILDETGAERLLGNGDMLFLPPGTSNLIRAQGAYVSDDEIHKIVEHICNQAPARYLIESFDMPTHTLIENDEPKDSLFEQAKDVVIDTGNASTTYLQRKLKVGYARAASLMDELEERGIVSPADGSKPRKVLVKSSLDDE